MGEQWSVVSGRWLVRRCWMFVGTWARCSVGADCAGWREICGPPVGCLLHQGEVVSGEMLDVSEEALFKIFLRQ
jgi:hypothetical protein